MTVDFSAMVGLMPRYVGSNHGVPSGSVMYRVYFIIKTMWPCFPSTSVIGRVAEFARIACAISVID